MPADIDKVIYLDSDIVVNLDINELWHIEPNEKVLGVVPTRSQSADLILMKQFNLCSDETVKLEDYFNAGVMLININSFREEEATIIDAMKFVAANPAYRYFDQDVLNYCFAARALKLPTKFNRYTRYARTDNETPSKKIYHYVGQNFFWSFNSDMHDPFSRLWMDYFIKTPFFDSESIGRLYESFQQIHIRLKGSMVKISAIMSGKTRAFFAPSVNTDSLRKSFDMRPDEEIIPADDKNAVANLVYAMGKAQGKKVFFLVVPDFQAVNELLLQLDFVLNKDFVNGMEFLSEAQGVPLDSHALIKAM